MNNVMYHLVNEDDAVVQSMHVYDLEDPELVNLGDFLKVGKTVYLVCAVSRDERKKIDIWLRCLRKRELN